MGWLVPAALCGLLWAQAEPQGKRLTARELFYAAAEKTPAEGPAPAPAPAPRPKARRTSPPPRPQPPPSTPAVPVTPATYDSRRQGPPLGLRYTLLKLADGRVQETAPDAAFHAGDRLQIGVEVNDAGYLYIVHQGSSGAWKPMFPSQEVEDGNNRVQPGRSYVMPPGSRFYFDEQPGEEKLFVVLSREPEQDLEKLIYSLQGTGTPQPAAEQPKRLLLVANMPPVSDELVGRLRNVYARDLLIEKVDDDTAGTRREKAVYVVNPTGSPDSRVVADIRLQHR